MISDTKSLEFVGIFFSFPQKENNHPTRSLASQRGIFPDGKWTKLFSVGGPSGMERMNNLWYMSSSIW